MTCERICHERPAPQAHGLAPRRGIGLTPAARSRIALDVMAEAPEPITRIELVMVRPGDVDPTDGQMRITADPDDPDREVHTLRLDQRLQAPDPATLPVRTERT